MRVLLTEAAQTDVLEENAWWRANRDEKDCFEDEVSAALSLLAASPGIGVRVPRRGGGDVRRLYLRKTKRYLFYLLDIPQQNVTVLRVWAAERGSTPRL